MLEGLFRGRSKQRVGVEKVLDEVLGCVEVRSGIVRERGTDLIGRCGPRRSDETRYGRVWFLRRAQPEWSSERESNRRGERR